MRHETIRSLVLCGLFAALCCVGGWITLPLPQLSITLQTLFTTLSGLTLGGKRGAASVAAYVALGLAGLPVFSGGGGGVAYVMRPSFGYLLGMILGAYVAGSLYSRWRLRPWGPAAASGLGFLAVYLPGLPYFWLMSRAVGIPMTADAALMTGCLLTLPGDIVKWALCLVAERGLRRILENERTA